MAKTGSFIKLDRGLKNNSLWLEKPFSKGQAWVDLLMLAQGLDKDRECRGKKKRMHRGNIYTSIYFLSTRWGWYRQKVYRFLDRLMMDGMITVQGWGIDDTTKRTVHDTTDNTVNDTTDNTVISVVNWDFYQCSDTTNDTTDNTVSCNANDTTNNTHKRKKDKDKENDKKNIPPKPPKGGQSTSGEQKEEPGREEGGYEDIPVKHRDGTYHSFETYADYWDWRNQ